MGEPDDQSTPSAEEEEARRKIAEVQRKLAAEPQEGKRPNVATLEEELCQLKAEIEALRAKSATDRAAEERRRIHDGWLSSREEWLNSRSPDYVASNFDLARRTARELRTRRSPKAPKKKTQHQRLVELMQELKLESGKLPREVRKVVVPKYKEKYHDEPSHSAITRAYKAYLALVNH
jgi:hypothetical protein